MWVWSLNCTLSHAFYEVLKRYFFAHLEFLISDPGYLDTFAFSSWFIFVYSPLHFGAKRMSFLKSSLTLPMTVDGTCIDNGPFQSKSLFFSANWTKETKSAIPSSQLAFEFN